MLDELIEERNLPRKDDRKFLTDGLEQCRAITEKYGTSYYFATQFFPPHVRRGIYAIYSFARIPDEIVDDPNKISTEDALNKLAEYRDKWRRAMETGGSDDAVMNAIVWGFREFEIPQENGEAFLRSMFLDEERNRYENFADLKEYMYGSAAVIGLMVTRIVGYSSDAAFPYAKELGYAFQVTNFLRDIREDVEDLGRIYMPLDELESFGLTPEDIVTQTYDERFVSFMKFQIERNREMYREARKGISMLAWRGRLAVKISYVLYKAILDEIEKVDYNVYRGRVRTSFKRKLWLTAKAVVGIYD